MTPASPRGHLAPVGRVIGFPVSPEQMLHAIGGVEQAVEQALVKLLQLVQHHGLAFTPGQVALVDERLLVDALVVDPGVVLDHPRGVKRADGRSQLAGIIGGMADREKGTLGVEVHGGRVELEGRLEADQVEPDEPTDGLQDPDLEPHSQPVAPLSFADFQLRGQPRRTQDHALRARVGVNGEVEPKVRAVSRLARADQVRLDRPVSPRLNPDEVLALS